MGRPIAALVFIAILAAATIGCTDDSAGGGATTQAATNTVSPLATATTPSTPVAGRDPTQRGPYAVGLARMTFTRTDGESPRVLDTWIWYPAVGAPSETVVEDAEAATDNAPFPLIIFSHGSGGQPNNATFLTEHLASWGYIVAAPPHPGNTSDDCIICPIDVIIRSAGQRLKDVPFVLDKLLSLRDEPSSTVGRIIDGERTAIAGHSFGGWTAIFMAPGDRFDVSIAMAPGEPRLALEPARKITSPALIIAGEKDEIVNPDHVRDLVAEVPDSTPLTYVSYPEGHHLTFIDNCLGCTDALSEGEGHVLTLRYVVSFLQLHLRGEAAYEQYLAPSSPDALVPGR